MAKKRKFKKPCPLVNTVYLGKTTRFNVSQVVINANLSYMHQGMVKAAKDIGIKVSEMKQGSCILFLNAKRTYCKLLVGNESEYPIVAAYRFPPGMRFPLEAVAHITHCFKSNASIGASEQLKDAMESIYAKAIKEKNLLPAPNQGSQRVTREVREIGPIGKAKSN